MTQEDLFALFNGFAAVERAWLQHHRRDSFQAGPGKKHRGFGFVVFKDDCALDQLLLGSNQFSQLLRLPNGRTLEVKRAISSCDILEGGSGGPLGPEAKRESSQAPLEEAPSEALQTLPQACAIVVPVVWSGLTWPVLPLPPTAPAGPGAEGQLPACQGGPSLSLPPPAFLTAIPLLALGAALARRSVLAPQGAEEARATEAERKSLETLLLQAMPDHYDD
jgi:hypothetical protein